MHIRNPFGLHKYPNSEGESLNRGSDSRNFFRKPPSKNNAMKIMNLFHRQAYRFPKRAGVFSLLLFALPFPAWAALGGTAASVEADRAQFQGTVQSIAAAQYTVQEITTSTGTLVREYVSPSGTVFAIAFNGPKFPDFKQLLGDYYGQLVQAWPQAHVRHAPLVIQQDNFVLQVGGRMRAFHGVAYLPGLVPAGVSAEEIR